jgi:hypothetical protein
VVTPVRSPRVPMRAHCQRRPNFPALATRAAGEARGQKSRSVLLPGLGVLQRDAGQLDA